MYKKKVDKVGYIFQGALTITLLKRIQSKVTKGGNITPRTDGEEHHFVRLRAESLSRWIRPLRTGLSLPSHGHLPPLPPPSPGAWGPVLAGDANSASSHGGLRICCSFCPERAFLPSLLVISHSHLSSILTFQGKLFQLH